MVREYGPFRERFEEYILEHTKEVQSLIDVHACRKRRVSRPMQVTL